MVTTVWNPAGQEGVLEVAVNEHAVTKKTSVAAGQTVEIRTALPGVEELAVRYTGNRYLVLLETAFE